jgi:hypothetical protein
VRPELAEFLRRVGPRFRFAPGDDVPRVQWVPEFPPGRLAFNEQTPDRLLASRDVVEGLFEAGFRLIGPPPPPYAWGQG